MPRPTVIAGGEEPRVRAVWEDSSFADMGEAIRDYLTHEGYPTFLEPGRPVRWRRSSPATT